MTDERQITRMLHDEHVGAIATLERLEGLLARHSPKKIPDPSRPEVKTTLAEVAAMCESDLAVHFGFEEDNLFPRLAEWGDSPISQILTSEHRLILPMGTRMAELAREALENGFSADSWVEFRRSGGELVERLIVHIQKEEMGLLPALDELLETEQDWKLAESYAAGR
ncbi:MAG: hemerythrin domain-containing protein [Sphingomonadales bacterium]